MTVTRDVNGVEEVAVLVAIRVRMLARPDSVAKGWTAACDTVKFRGS